MPSHEPDRFACTSGLLSANRVAVSQGAISSRAGAVLNTAGVQADDSVVMVGSGGVGLNAIAGAVVTRATTIIAVDIADNKVDTAKTFGATHGINSSTEDPVEAVQRLTDGGADAVFDFVGHSKVTQQSRDLVAPGGGLYLVGNSDVTAEIPLSNSASSDRRSLSKASTWARPPRSAASACSPSST